MSKKNECRLAVLTVRRFRAAREFARVRKVPFWDSPKSRSISAHIRHNVTERSGAAVDGIEFIDAQFLNIVGHVIPPFLTRDHSLMIGGRREYTARFIDGVMRVTLAKLDMSLPAKKLFSL